MGKMFEEGSHFGEQQKDAVGNVFVDLVIVLWVGALPTCCKL